MVGGKGGIIDFRLNVPSTIVGEIIASLVITLRLRKKEKK